MAILVTANIKGLDDRGRLLRRTVMRYLMIGYVMNLRSICPSVKRRFPTLEHLTRAGNQAFRRNDADRRHEAVRFEL